MRRLPFALAASLLFAVTGCTTSEFYTTHIGTTPALVTTADVRVIIERPGRNGIGTVICTEASPDVAKALSAAQSLSGAGGADGTSGSATLTSSTAEALSQLSGRVPGIVALRDSMFAACSAYANGVLGADAYAMILSRYGELLTTLILADAASSGPRPVPPAAASPILTLPDSAFPKLPGKAAGASFIPSAPAEASATDNAPDAGTATLLLGAVDATDPGITDARKLAVKATIPAPAAAPDDADTKADSAGPSPAIAAEIGKMQWEYLHLSVTAPIMVACINEYDPTRAMPLDAAGTPIRNPLLETYCGPFIRALLDKIHSDTVRGIPIPRGGSRG